MKSNTATATAKVRMSTRDRVILEHLPLARAIAVRVHSTLPVHVDLDDLVHAGVLGLIDAVAKYDPEKQVAFSSYAKHRIKGAMLDSLRKLDWASRDLRKRQKQAERAKGELMAELQRAPTEEEIAARLGIDVEGWRRLLAEMHQAGLVSASTRGQDGEDLPAPDFPGKADLQPDLLYGRSELRTFLGHAMESLPERYRMVMTLYYTGDMTMKEIGELMGVNESRVSQIHKAALEKMAAALEKDGIRSPAAF